MTSTIAIARYLLLAHLRTRAFVAPGAATAVGIVTIDSVRPNPVLSTAGSAAVLLFFSQAWLGLALLNTQRAADRWTLASAAGHRALACGRLIAGAAAATVTAVAAVLYPVAAGRFDHAPSPGELAICLVASVAASLAGTALSAPFAEPLVRNRAVATLGLAACALLTVPLGPPAAWMARALDTTDAAAVLRRLVPDLAAIAGFLVVVAVGCAALWRRRD